MTTRRAILRTGAAAAASALAAGNAATAFLRATPASAAPHSERPDLQAALDQIVAAGASGALAEFHDDTTDWRSASGVAELGTSRPVPSNGRFRIGSVTKTYVATVVLQLAGEGRITLDDTIEQWLPAAVTNGDRITVRNLLQHTSGIYDYTDPSSGVFQSLDDVLRRRYEHWSPNELLALTAGRPPVFDPGTSWSYSNTDYILLGMLIQRVTGQPYGAEITRRILRPLGLYNTQIPGDNPDITGPHSHGYLARERDNDVVPVDVTAFNMSIAGSAGEIISTATEVNHFFRALITGRLLAPAMLEQMLANPVGPGYGLGIEQHKRTGGDTLWGHSGQFFGFTTYAVTTADGRRQLAISTNPWGPDDHGQAISNLLDTAFYGSSPTTRTTTPPPRTPTAPTATDASS